MGNDSDPDNDGDLGSQTKEETAVDVPTHQVIILDATVVEQAICFPTDFSLLNEAREISERIIGVLYPQTDIIKNPQTIVRRKERHASLS